MTKCEFCSGKATEVYAPHYPRWASCLNNPPRDKGFNVCSKCYKDMKVMLNNPSYPKEIK